MTDPVGGRLLTLSADGTLLDSRSFTRLDGNPVRPIGIAVDPQGRIWLVDSEVNTILVVPDE